MIQRANTGGLPASWCIVSTFKSGIVVNGLLLFIRNMQFADYYKLLLVIEDMQCAWIVALSAKFMPAELKTMPAEGTWIL